MRYSAATLAFAAGAQAAYNYTSPSYTTEVVTAYTTYCPYATEIAHNGVTYTVSEATTLTITNCPCTVTKPVSSALVTSCSESTTAEEVVYTSAESVYTLAPPVTATEATATEATVTEETTTAAVYTAPPVVYTSSGSVYTSQGAVYTSVATVPYPVANSTAAYVPTGTGSSSTSATAYPTFTGAANKAFAASGAGLAAVFGLAAYVL